MYIITQVEVFLKMREFSYKLKRDTISGHYLKLVFPKRKSCHSCKSKIAKDKTQMNPWLTPLRLRIKTLLSKLRMEASNMCSYHQKEGDSSIIIEDSSLIRTKLANKPLREKRRSPLANLVMSL